MPLVPTTEEPSMVTSSTPSYSEATTLQFGPLVGAGIEPSPTGARGTEEEHSFRPPPKTYKQNDQNHHTEHTCTTSKHTLVGSNKILSPQPNCNKAGKIILHSHLNTKVWQLFKNDYDIQLKENNFF